ncbi:MAG: BatD family protein [Bacteroidota bacterium]
MKRLLSSSVICLFALNLVWAQEPVFKVSMNLDSVFLGNRFKVSFTLENGQAANFQAPTFSEFHLLGGPNQASSFSMINGAVTQSITYSYVLEPKDIGNFYIEAASIDADGTTMYTAPLEVIVISNPDGVIQESQPQPRTFEFFSQPDLKAPSQKKKPKKKRKVYRI